MQSKHELVEEIVGHLGVGYAISNGGTVCRTTFTAIIRALGGLPDNVDSKQEAFAYCLELLGCGDITGLDISNGGTVTRYGLRRLHSALNL